MPDLKGSRTVENLKAAFRAESQAIRRYVYFARQADAEGHSAVAGVFRDIADGETAHAHGHLDHLKGAGDPATGEPIGSTKDNLAGAVAVETHEATEMYPEFAETARDEGFDEIAEWFQTLAKAEKGHAERFQKRLDGLAE